MRETPPRLGRGLAALLGETTTRPNTPTQVIDHVAVDCLEANPFQPRRNFDEAGLEELAASITSQGVLQPLLVRPHPVTRAVYQIVAGERRWRAARQAGLTTVPCYIRSLDDRALSAAALVENLQRKDLDPIEEAEGYQRLITDFRITNDDLATAIGKSRSHVANLLRLPNLPETVKAQVQSGLLTAGHARAALATPNPQAAAAEIIAGGLTVRQAEALASNRAATDRKQQATGHDADLRAVEAELSEVLGLAVSIRFDGRGGAIRLRYHSLDQLDYVIGKLKAN